MPVTPKLCTVGVDYQSEEYSSFFFLFISWNNDQEISVQIEILNVFYTSRSKNCHGKSNQGGLS